MGLLLRDFEANILTVIATTRGFGTLEGVDSTIIESLDNRRLSDFFKGSRHFGQVRVIAYESMNGINPSLLSKCLGKPVLEIVPDSEFNEMTTVRFGGLVVKPLGIDEASTMRVLKVINCENRIPAIELARMIADSLL
jgi:hypothetical protein